MAMCEDDIQKLQDTRLTGDKLRTQLEPKVKCLRTKQLDQPRTVCVNIDCVEFRDDGKGNNTMLTDFIQLCHAPCYLTDVKPGVLSYPSLVNCRAFAYSDNCAQCQHHWSEHQHVLTELEEYEAVVKDMGITEQLQNHASDLTLRQAAIMDRKNRIEEYEAEHKAIQEAAAKFGLWLRDNSITPYNDATLAYLDVLIKQEEAKANAGYNDEKLRSLRKDYEKHQELVSVLEGSMTHDTNYRPLDPQSIARLANDLYKLKHFGKMLENVKLTIAAAHEGTYRERPHHVHNKTSSRSWNPLSAIFGTKSPRGPVQVIAPSRHAQMERSFSSGQEQARAYPHQIPLRAPPPVIATAPTQMPTNGNVVRLNTLQKAQLPLLASIKCAKTFSMPSLNPFKRN